MQKQPHFYFTVNKHHLHNTTSGTPIETPKLKAFLKPLIASTMSLWAEARHYLTPVQG